MSSLANSTLNFKSFGQINFAGGKLSSHGGMFLLGEFMTNMGITSFIKENFGVDDEHKYLHRNADILLQLLYQHMAGDQTDDAADHLADDPIMKKLLHKERLASQPTLSRFRNRLGYAAQIELNHILKFTTQQAYKVHRPSDVIFDLDTTILRTYGRQVGGEYIHHYQAVGYHPLLCYDGNTGDLLNVELRNGSMYCGNEAADFVRPLLEEYPQDYPETAVLLRGDSGFAMPDLYDGVEDFRNARYVIRLKNNAVLQNKVETVLQAFMSNHAGKAETPTPCYGEFFYAAKTWKKERRVVYKIEPRHSEGATEWFPTCTFIVTNRDDAPEDIVRIYCQRGNMENFIKESKNDFHFEHMCSHKKIINQNRLLIAAIAYNIFNLFRRLCLPKTWKKFRVHEVRLRMLRLACRYVSHAKNGIFKFWSTYLFKEHFAYVYQQVVNLRT